jgi:uncharacterized repeat protein (TIGR03803 family)
MVTIRPRLFSASILLNAFVTLVTLFAGVASPAQTLTTAHRFAGSPSEGAWPRTGLIQAADGNFYGTTSSGGDGNCTFGCGTAFEITAGGTLTTLFNFDFSTAGPSSGLLQANNGNFYGTTSAGGNFSVCPFNGCGTVFELTAGGTFTTLYSFCAQPNCSDGGGPISGVIQARNGSLYGTTFGGGAVGDGTVFELTTAGTLTTLNSFSGTNGIGPGVLLQATDDNFYGTTLEGGLNGNGTVFDITPSGTLTMLYSFCSQTNCADGGGPAILIQASDGNFYGTTLYGGAYENGTVFEITAGGTLTTIYSFCPAGHGCIDGSEPTGLMQAADGNFYGTTLHGGGSSIGTIFEIIAGKLTTIHTFAGSGGSDSDGANPYAGVMQAADGSFYGTTTYGGTSSNCSQGCGTVFNLIVPATTSTTLASSLNPSVYGQSVTWTATVTTSGSVAPTGTVNFEWGGGLYSFGSAKLNASGVATFTSSKENADTYAMTAVYMGDANNLGSTSAVLDQVITETTSSATLTSSPNPSTFGQSVTFTATISSPTVIPTGPVTFTAGKTVLGTAQLSGGKAKFTTSSLAVGSTTVTATYSGDSNISESSASVIQTVTTTSGTTTATLTWLADPPQNETFTATVTSPKGIPTGSVTFTVGNTVLGTTQLSDGIATLTTSTLAVGSNTVTATYNGDANNSPTSAWATQTFVMPYNATLYLQQQGGSAGAVTEFGTGTSSSNFVEFYSGLPNDPNPTGQVLVGSFNAGTIVNFGMFTVYGSQSGWAFSTGTDQASLVAFADLDNTLGLNHSITQQTSSTTWVLHLDDALSYLYDDDNNDVIMEIVLVAN